MPNTGIVDRVVAVSIGCNHHVGQQETIIIVVVVMEAEIPHRTNFVRSLR